MEETAQDVHRGIDHPSMQHVRSVTINTDQVFEFHIKQVCNLQQGRVLGVELFRDEIVPHQSFEFHVST